MPTFKRTEIVDARQFHGGTQNASSLILWVESHQNRASYLTDRNDSFERIMVQVEMYKHHPAYVGDWIVLNQDGSFSVVRPQTFESDYEQV